MDRTVQGARRVFLHHQSWKVAIKAGKSPMLCRCDYEPIQKKSVSTATEILGVQITSPSDTESTIMDMNVPEVFQKQNKSKQEMPYCNVGNVVTVHFWDEVPQDNTDVQHISMKMYGTGRGNMDNSQEEIQSDNDDSRRETHSTQLYYLCFLLFIIPIGILCAIVVIKCKARRDEGGKSPHGSD